MFHWSTVIYLDAGSALVLFIRQLDQGQHIVRSSFKLSLINPQTNHFLVVYEAA